MQEWKYREHNGKMGKFRVGDLVRMSSYGKSAEQNSNQAFDGNEMGMIVEMSPLTWEVKKYPIKVQWINITNHSVPRRFFFRELVRIRT